MKIAFSIITNIFICSHVTFGLTSLSPYPFFHTPTENWEFCLEIIPTEKTLNARIRCINLVSNEREPRKVMWEVIAEYPFPGEIFLARNGKTMVLIDTPDRINREEELSNWKLLKFYSSGELVSTVLLSDILDISKIKISPYFTVGYDIFENKNKIAITYADSEEIRILDLSKDIKFEENDEVFSFSAQGHTFYYRMSDGKLVLKK